MYRSLLPYTQFEFDLCDVINARLVLLIYALNGDPERNDSQQTGKGKREIKRLDHLLVK